ncbi:HAMP domain-containing sensor histidine kinase [Paenibacillus chondroitinus]|uniref:histidine kinase n=1 Tax=Paenibacillus chondroitinus TaxID=59842 RepID=A0ABU6D8R5_9BACL|nr:MULTISPECIES: HAMP domain-containing sensor histidine kinase [Paenibacillus]MCY9661602.1 HAMP domain-containing histidine kinase [Paenibacillus anseongense]MEB4793687.1 HAMP domain-containing sensor histidine kinase [Paenibacillus chondroitinus]
MLFVTLVLLIFTILFTYKKLNHASTRFMYGIIIGWVLSFVAFTLYLSKFNYYFNVIHTFFDFSPGTWNYLVLTKFNPDWLIRMLNIGVGLFYCSLLGFAIAFTRSLSPWHQRIGYGGILLFFIIETTYFDPSFHIALSNQIDSLTFFRGMEMVIKSLRYLILFVAFGLLINYYLNYPKIKFIKNLTLYHVLLFIPLVVIHLFIFSWAPKVLVKETYLKGYFNYLQPPLGYQSILLPVFPFAIYLILFLMIYLVYKFNSIEIYRKNRDIQINKSIDTATLGTRAFTHALKNHLIGIQSEAAYLKERHQADSESQYSLDLILRSSQSALASINDAADKLKNISLNLQPMSIDLPVQQAIARLNEQASRCQVDYSLDSLPANCYIDFNHLTEAIYNLLLNASESLLFRDDGRIVVERSQQNGWALIRITDNGPGVAEEHLEAIFDPFFTTKASVNNWGIGLSYCHKIIIGHDGKIVVESKKDVGTTFTVYLPII